MWDFLVRQLLKEAGRKIAGKLFNDELSGPEAYADRIKRDFHLQDYADAWALYDSDRAHWERYCSTRPSVDEGLDGRFGKWGSMPAGNGPLPGSDRSESLDKRFGNWSSVPAGSLGEIRSPVRRTMEKYARSAAADDGIVAQGEARSPKLPDEEFVLDDQSKASATPLLDAYPRLRRVSSASPGIIPPDPDVPPPEPGRPLGIYSGKPMPLWTTPLPLQQLLNKSSASGNNDGFNFLAGLAYRNPSQPAAPAAALAPPDDANFSGGLLGRLAAVAGMNPQNRSQPAPATLDDDGEQADMQALEARLANSGNIRDAVALHNARRSSRR